MSQPLLIQGTALALPLKDASVHCCVTSAPYWKLRSYGIGAAQGEIGQEETLEAYVEVIVQVFREVWRVLRPDGTLWLNMGDSYAQGATGKRGDTHTPEYGDGVYHRRFLRMMGKETDSDFLPSRKPPPGIPAKNLLGMPWRIALALHADGWILRSDIIWDKRNPMPESVQDRPTRSHEYVFLFSKQPRYYYDAEAIKEPQAESTMRRTDARIIGPKMLMKECDSTEYPKGQRVLSGGRNARTVWRVPSEPFSGAHFATFPPALVRRCLLAGAPSAVCRQCGAPWRRQREVAQSWRETAYEGSQAYTTVNRTARAHIGPGMSQSIYAETGFTPTCTCAADIGKAVVFDPFCGSGTTLLVARELGHHAIGLDLSSPYLHDIASERLSLTALAVWQGTASPTAPAIDYGSLPLFARGDAR